jgi:hypothetical protein
MEDARRAGLAKNMYEKYPATMLYNRAMSLLARQLFPDVIKGAGYAPEELKEIKREVEVETPVMEEVEVKEETINEIQHKALMGLLSECPEDYQTRVLDYLKKKGFDDLGMPVSLYNEVYERALVKRNETPAEEE